MPKLPDLEGLAIFAKVAERRSFAVAAAQLRLSKATVSKAVRRIEDRLGAQLIVRTARRFELTAAGRQLIGRASNILAEGEAAEDVTRAHAQTPRGVVRLAAPMSFGVKHVAPLLPDFLLRFPQITVDLHLSDAMDDLLGNGYDAAIRIAVQPGASFTVQRLCEMPRYLVASPAYLRVHGTPKHPLQLAQHRCISYSYTMTSEVWRFTKGKKSVTVRPSGPLRANNGDAMMPALLAGIGIGVLPNFILRESLEAGLLESVLPNWSIALGALYWVTPAEGLPPKRVEVLGNFLAERLVPQ